MKARLNLTQMISYEREDGTVTVPDKSMTCDVEASDSTGMTVTPEGSAYMIWFPNWMVVCARFKVDEDE